MEPNANPPTEPPRPERALYAGYAVEGGLGVLAVGIAWAAGIPLADELGFSLAAVGWGLLATLPMLLALLVLTHVSWAPIARIREIVRLFARQLLIGASWLEIATLCALAGIGEELLFRGVIQTLIADRTNVALGVLWSGVLFGAVHFLTTTYFVLAVCVGWYFGWLYVATESLTAPIVAHAAYDFVALVVVIRGGKGNSPSDASQGE